MGKICSRCLDYNYCIGFFGSFFSEEILVVVWNWLGTCGFPFLGLVRNYFVFFNNARNGISRGNHMGEVSRFRSSLRILARQG